MAIRELNYSIGSRSGSCRLLKDMTSLRFSLPLASIVFMNIFSRERKKKLFTFETALELEQLFGEGRQSFQFLLQTEESSQAL